MRLSAAPLGPLALAACMLASGCNGLAVKANTADAPQAERGTLQVGGLRTPPGTLTLPYVHYHTPGRVRPTVFFLTGGPGVSNVKHVPPPQWLGDFDVVVLEYRGVGRSSIVLDSPHFARALLRYGEGPASGHDAALGLAYRDAFADLARQGVDFDEFSVDALADDIERLRAKLGLEQIYLVGHSFGTRIALSYQTRYRQRAAGSILFAMNTPGGFIWHPEQTQRVWSRYRTALSRMDPPAATALGHMLDASPAARKERYGLLSVNNAKANMVAFFMSFNGGGRDSVLAAMAPERTTGSWYLYSLGYDMFIRFGFNWADFYVKAYTSDCNRAAIKAIGEQGRHALFGSPSSALFAGADGFEAAGGRCDAPALVPDYRNTLAIMGEFDPSCPIERKPDGMPDARFVVIPGAGHADVFYANQGATANWLRRFFLHPDQARPPGAERLSNQLSRKE